MNDYLERRRRFAWLPVRVYDSNSRWLAGGDWIWLRWVVETENMWYGWVAYSRDNSGCSDAKP